jgi:hypothetical protein
MSASAEQVDGTDQQRAGPAGNRQAQGLPPKVEDPAVLARVAELMDAGPKVEGSA